MAVLTEQINFLLAASVKRRLDALQTEDAATTSDVIRLAIVVGLPEAEGMPSDARRVAYAHLRAGLPLSA